jgi:pimeloyl-ACP methyl ester carboxylesterase
MATMPAMAAPELVTSSDGTRIAVWRSGHGPDVILVHGTTADHTRWAAVAAGLEARFRLHLMDRRGRGGSGDADVYSIEQEGRDVVAVAQQAAGPVSLLGHSYGGLCCIEAAMRLPGLHRLVLYEPPVPTGSTIVPAAVYARLKELLERDQREAALLVFFREVVAVPEAQLQLMRAQPAWAGRVRAMHTVLREARLEAEYHLDLQKLRAVATPTLLLLGGDSPPFFHEATRRLNDALPNSRIHEMPGQQHVAMDAIPGEFIEIVASFLLS